MEIRTIVAYTDNAAQEGAWFSRLGFFVDVKSEDHSIVDLGTVRLELHTEEAESIEEFQEEAAIRPRAAGVYLYVEVADIDEKFAEISCATTYLAPRQRPWGNREVLAISPSGLRVMFYS